MNRLLDLDTSLRAYYHPKKRKGYLARAAACEPQYTQSYQYLPHSLSAITGIFSSADVSRMKTFLIDNADKNKTKSGENCIDTLNTAISLLMNDNTLPKHSSIQATMKALRGISLASPPTIIEFNDKNGKKTTGVRAPDTIRENVYDTLKKMSRNEKGWSVFGMSLTDGYHSTLVAYDNNSSTPKAYWCDQWPSKGGWKYYDKDGLDDEVERLTLKFWNDFRAEKQRRTGKIVSPRTRLTLWRLYKKVVKA